MLIVMQKAIRTEINYRYFHKINRNSYKEKQGI